MPTSYPRGRDQMADVCGGTVGTSLAVAGFRFEEYRYQTDERVERHAHPRPQLTYVVAGVYDEQVGGRWSSLAQRRAPAVLYLPDDVPHAAQHFVPGRHLTIGMTADRLARLPSLIREPRELRDADAFALAYRALHEFRTLSPDSELILEGIVLMLLGTVQKGLQIYSEPRPGWLRRLHEALADDFRYPWTLKTLSHQVGVNPEHLTARFAQTFGVTPGEYLRRRRLRYAAQLLISPDALPISEVALQAGFADQAHFSRCFRTWLGVPPLEFRRASGVFRGRKPQRTVSAILGRSPRPA